MKTILLILITCFVALSTKAMATAGSVQSCTIDGSTINRLKISEVSQSIYIIYQKGLPHFKTTGRIKDGMLNLDFISEDRKRLSLLLKIEGQGPLLVCFTSKGGVIVDQSPGYVASHRLDDLSMVEFEQAMVKVSITDVCPAASSLSD